MSTESQKTIKVYVHVPFTDANGPHGEGEQIDLPNDTDVQQAEVQALIAYGVVGTKPKAPAPKTSV